MAIFNEIGKKISQTTQSAVKGTKDLTEIAKINSQISDEQKQQNSLYMQIGKKYYELYSDSAEDENFAPMCASISESIIKVENYREEINKIKGLKKCAGCGAEIPISTFFCGTCGFDTRTEDSEAAATEAQATQAVVCPSCSAEMQDDVAFCTGCGHKL